MTVRIGVLSAISLLIVAYGCSLSTSGTGDGADRANGSFPDASMSSGMDGARPVAKDATEGSDALDVFDASAGASDAGDAAVIDATERDDGSADGGAGESRLPCGATTCAQATQSCCYPPRPGPPTCIARGGTCVGTAIECGDRRDCRAGEACCFLGARISCVNALGCGGGNQICDPKDGTSSCPVFTSCKFADGSSGDYGFCRT
jgi:hypothetical protein